MSDSGIPEKKPVAEHEPENEVVATEEVREARKKEVE